MTSPDIGHLIAASREREQYRQGFTDGAALHVLRGDGEVGSVMGRRFTLRVEWEPVPRGQDEAWQRNVARFRESAEARSAAAHR
jgi:hypothetical protein